MFALVALSIWRLGVLITEENGPYDVFKKLRQATNGFKLIDLDCFKCTSVWLSLPFAFIFRTDWYVLIYWLALAGVVALVHTVYERLL